MRRIPSELQILFHTLRRRRIQYCLLSNYTETDFKNTDIDLYVVPSSRIEFLTILKEAGWMERIEPVFPPFRCFYYKKVGVVFLCLDVKYDLFFGYSPGEIFYLKSGFFNYKEGVVLDQAGFIRPKGLFTVLFYLIHILREKKQIEEYHWRRLNQYLRNYESEEGDPKRYREMKKHISRKQWKIIINKFFYTERRRRIYKNRKGPGYCVYFIGTDGSGKSALIDYIRTHFRFKTTTLYLGENQWAFPALKWFYPKRSRNRFFNALFVYFLYPLDLYLRRLKGFLFSRYYVVLIDRIPGFPFFSSRIIRFIYGFILPRPRLIVQLSGDAGKIYQRKKGRTLLNVKQDMEKWNNIYHMFKVRKITVDTTKQSIEDSAQLVMDAIMSDRAFIRFQLREIRI